MDSKATLTEVFHSFAGGDQMDGRAFMKLATNCKLLDKKLTSTDIDLIFPKVKDKGARKITYAQFKEALKLCAAKKGMEVDALEDKIAETGGPTYSGTKAEAVKYHDDKSLYTGMYGKGGPAEKGPSGPDLSKSSVPMEEKKAAPAKKVAMETKHVAASSLE